MRRTITLLLLVFFFSCSKEQLAKNAVINAMTSGQWKIVSFKNGTADVSADFAAYAFQFKENLTVDAIHNASIEKTGTWTADANAKTITSTFTGAAPPLVLLNGTWQITNNSWNFVEASQTVNGAVKSLRLEKM